MEAVARHGSFTLAARELGVSQPTVSNLIYSLERQFSCRLLDRSGTSITPTAQLDEIGGHIKSVLTLSSAISQHLASGRELLSGRFNIGYSTYHIAMPIIADFVRAYPQLEVGVSDHTSDDLLAEMRHGNLDAVFFTAQSVPEDLNGIEVCQTRVGLAVPKTHPLAANGRLAWSQMSNLPLIQALPGSGIQKIFDTAARRANAPLHRLLQLDSWGSALSLVRQDIGFAIALEPECADEPDITFVNIADPSLLAIHYLVCQPALRDTAPVQRLMETADARCSAPTTLTANL